MPSNHQATPAERFEALRGVVRHQLEKRLPTATVHAVLDAIREARRLDAFPDNAADVVDETELQTWADLVKFRDALEVSQ
jgi:hypothetical protein